jgi:RNA polymerase sigma-70 factor (ECF subfamily)
MLETDEEKGLFEQIYRTYKQDMYAVAYGVLNNVEDAEDVVSQSLLTIANNFTKVSQIPCNEMRAYIVIISKNTAINLYRQNRERTVHCTKLSESELVDETYFESREFYELTKAVSKLPQIYKDVIYLYYLQGFTYKETASQLGIKYGVVRQRALRAKTMLKNILEVNGDYDSENK